MVGFGVYTILSALATWRLANMIADDSEVGPFGVFTWIRANSWFVSDWFGDGINCVWCMSFWVAAAITALSCALGHLPWDWIPVWWPAVSALAIAFNHALRRMMT